jgi:hypothetical protein
MARHGGDDDADGAAARHQHAPAGEIAGLPDDIQAKIKECAEKIRSLVKEYAEEGTVA